MIDSLVFSIDNVSKNEISKRLMRILLTGINPHKRIYNAKEFKTDLVNKKSVFNKREYNFYNSVITLPSSGYDIAYIYNEFKDELQFNCSLPKTLYGNNVLMFFNHNQLLNAYHEAINWNIQVQKTYKNLYKFLKYFFTKIIGSLDIDELFYLVKIDRIDLCVNQFFNSKDEAMQYINAVKRVRKAKSRIIAKSRQYETTGLYYTSDNFTCKIYHKGTEFDKNDAKELYKRSIYPTEYIEELQKYADRIVRYEMEFRSKYLSKLFREYIFRRNDSFYKKVKYCFKLSRKKCFELDYPAFRETSKKMDQIVSPNLLDNIGLMYYQKYHEARILYINSRVNDTKLRELYNEIKKLSKMYEKYYNSTIKCYLKQTEKEKILNTYTIEEMQDITDNTEFSFELFSICFKKFHDFVEEYQLKQSVFAVENTNAHEILTRKITENGYNWKVSPLLSMFNLLQQGKSFDDIKRQNIFPESTYFNLKAKLKKLGIENKCIDYFNITRTEPLLSYTNQVYYKINSKIAYVLNNTNFRFI